MSTKRKQVAFPFGEAGHRSTANELGGKGLALSELVLAGLPVPPGFTVTTSVAAAYAQHRELPRRLGWQLDSNLRALEKFTGCGFGSTSNPLLVSVRSGAPVSMPGMMDTVLNLGLNPETVVGLTNRTNERFAYDCYRRFLSQFGSVVLGVHREHFDAVWTEMKQVAGVTEDCRVPGHLQRLTCDSYRGIIRDVTGNPVPDVPAVQLHRALVAVLQSASSERAQAYRKAHKLAFAGTAVNVQAMVFGNFDDASATGVVFSSNVATGEPGMWGEFLPNAQGEDVVAGVRTPMPIAAMKEWNSAVYAQLEAAVKQLAKTRRQVVDVEFTVQAGKLYILQVRGAKLAPEALVTLTVHRVWEKDLTREAAVKSVGEEPLKVLTASGFSSASLAAATADGKVLGRGLPASPGAAIGVVVTSSAAAVAAKAKGLKVVLVQRDTLPEHLPGMLAAVAIVTETGGKTSHAAVVARGLGKPAVVGCEGLRLKDGDVISVDGATGMVVDGPLELTAACNKKEVNIFLKWVYGDEALLWPAPRLDFAFVDQSADCGQMVATFYLTDLMAQVAKGSSLGKEAAALRAKVHTNVAERLAMYLTLAVGGEVRHAFDHWTGYGDAVRELRRDFGVALDHSDRFESQKSSVNKLRTCSPADQVRFLELVTAVFEAEEWKERKKMNGEPIFGGPKWAAIARAALLFLKGELTHSVFADHAFDLQHNGGSVFGKNQMIRVTYALARMLDAKKHAKGVAELRRLMNGFVPGQADIEELYHRGVRAKLWDDEPAK